MAAALSVDAHEGAAADAADLVPLPQELDDGAASIAAVATMHARFSLST